MDRYYELLERVIDIREITEGTPDPKDVGYHEWQLAKLDRMTARRKRGAG